LEYSSAAKRAKVDDERGDGFHRLAFFAEASLQFELLEGQCNGPRSNTLRHLYCNFVRCEALNIGHGEPGSRRPSPDASAGPTRMWWRPFISLLWIHQ
jgi:hypothetical protein